MSEWQTIESAPDDGTPHLRGLHVRHSPTGEQEHVYWACYYGSVNEDGQWEMADGEDCGWEADDFTHWMPILAPPEPASS